MTLADHILSRYLQAAKLLIEPSDTLPTRAENTSHTHQAHSELAPPEDPPSRGLATQHLLRRQAKLIVELHTAWAAGDNKQCPVHVDQALLRTRLDDLAALCMSMFYAYRFDQLPYLWRQIYTDTLILHSHLEILVEALALGRTGAGTGNGARALLGGRTIDRVVAHLDRALITAGGAGTVLGTPWIEGTLELLDRFWRAQEHTQASGSSSPRMPVLFSDAEPFGRPRIAREHECPRRSGLGLTAFEAYMNASTEGGPRPLVLEGLLDAWPARGERPWGSPAYLLAQTLGGKRLVPVEVGRSYVDAGWAQELMPFKEFLGRHILLPSEDTGAHTDTDTGTGTGSSGVPSPGYLAQHDLFRQIPALRRDVLVPDLCWADVPGHPSDPARDQPPLAAPRLNAWFGPARTITPLHTDGYHNLLCQVVGAKYVRLYPPAAGGRLRPRGAELGVDMSNTSGLDLGVLEGWDAVPEDEDGEGEGEAEREELERAREALRGVEYWECVLGPGDTLLIPLGWWHYVRSLSTSFSVSFWWN